MRKLAILAAAGLVLCGCAVPRDIANDPWETSNRKIFDLNLKVDRTALRPTAERYNAYVSEKARDAIRVALDNLHAPVIFANDVLQGEGERAGVTAGRFLVNSTLGLAGMKDVAAGWGLQPHDEDFGQTLAVWGVREGPYMVLPFLGPSNPRDAAGRLVDLALDPTNYIKIKRHVMWSLGREYINILDVRTRNLESLDDIERDSLDFYATTRSLYRQYRAGQIRNGKPAPQDPVADPAP